MSLAFSGGHLYLVESSFCKGSAFDRHFHPTHDFFLVESFVAATLAARVIAKNLQKAFGPIHTCPNQPFPHQPSVCDRHHHKIPSLTAEGEARQDSGRELGYPGEGAMRKAARGSDRHAR